MVTIITEVENCPGIQFIGQEELSKKILEFWIDLKCVEVWFIPIVNILQDGAEEASYVEVVHAREFTDICGIKLPLIDTQSLHSIIDRESEMIAPVIAEVWADAYSTPKSRISVIYAIPKRDTHIEIAVCSGTDSARNV